MDWPCRRFLGQVSCKFKDNVTSTGAVHGQNVQCMCYYSMRARCLGDNRRRVCDYHMCIHLTLIKGSVCAARISKKQQKALCVPRPTYTFMAMDVYSHTILYANTCDKLGGGYVQDPCP